MFSIEIQATVLYSISAIISYSNGFVAKCIWLGSTLSFLGFDIINSIRSFLFRLSCWSVDIDWVVRWQQPSAFLENYLYPFIVVHLDTQRRCNTVWWSWWFLLTTILTCKCSFCIQKTQWIYFPISNWRIFEYTIDISATLQSFPLSRSIENTAINYLFWSLGISSMQVKCSAVQQASVAGYACRTDSIIGFVSVSSIGHEIICAKASLRK